MQSTWPTTCKCARCKLHECTQVISYCSSCCCCCCSFCWRCSTSFLCTPFASGAQRPKACLRNCRCCCCCCCTLHVQQSGGDTLHLSGFDLQGECVAAPQNANAEQLLQHATIITHTHTHRRSHGYYLCYTCNNSTLCAFAMLFVRNATLSPHDRLPKKR